MRLPARWMFAAATGLILLVVVGALFAWKSRQQETPVDAARIASLRCEAPFRTEIDAAYRLASSHDDVTYPYSLSVRDQDGDGRPDIVVSEADGSAFIILRNEGALKFSKHILRVPAAQMIERHLWADIDGDGQDDLVYVDNAPGSIHWLDRGERPVDIAPHGAFPRAYNLAAADFDGDGRTDIAATNFIGGDLRLYFNPGKAGGSWRSELIDQPGADLRGVAAGDISGNGRPDFAVAARLSNSIFWYENTPDGWQRHLVDDSLRLPTRLHLVDMDGDGDLDLLVAAGYFATEEADSVGRCATGIVWYENAGQPGKWPRHAIRVPFVSGFEVSATDRKGAAAEVAAVAYGTEGRIVHLSAPGDPRGQWTMATVNDRFPFGVDVVLADLNGDGNPEIVASAVRAGKIGSGQVQIWTRP